MSRRGLKTYSLPQEGRPRRVPSVYEIVSSQLLYYPGQGFAVRNPIVDWYRRYQTDSALELTDPEAFVDPAATTYRAYVERQRDAAAFDEALFRRAPDDGLLSDAWLQRLRRIFAPLRYPYHALGMMAAYVGSMAPGGRITIAAAFQAANETRRVHAFARRLALLRRTRPHFGDDARSLWETDAGWQPLRRTIEQALTTWDWGEAFVALGLALKPALDALVHAELAVAARANADPLLAELLGSLGEDATWERQWTRALVRTAIEQREANGAVLQAWVDRWRPAAHASAAALAPLLDITQTPWVAPQTDFLVSCGLRGEP